MKKLLVLLFIVVNLYALDSLSTIPDEQKKLFDNIITGLNLPNNDLTKNTINDLLKDFLVSGWSVHWMSNASAKGSKIKGSSTQICDITIYNNSRITNITFVYFKNEKQLFVNTKEYIETSSDLAIKKFNEAKSNPQYVLQNEADNYAYFQEKNILNYYTYHIKSPIGMVVYESFRYIDIP